MKLSLNWQNVSSFGRWLGLVAAVACGAAACSGAGDAEGDVGAAELAVVNVPAGVLCFEITAQGASRSASRTINVMPGQTIQATLNALPTGQVTFTGEGFGQACSAVSATSVPTWISDPVTVTVKTNPVVNVSLVLHPNGRATVGADFQDDPTCSSSGSACQTNAQCCAGLVCQGNVCTTPAMCSSLQGSCSVDSDCCAGLACTNGLCLKLGQCAADSDCPAGQLCDLTTNNCVGGACTPPLKPCDPTLPPCCMGLACTNGLCLGPNQCLTNADCPAGESCLNTQCTPTMCVPLGAMCNASIPCCNGIACSATGMCLPPGACNVDADCPASAPSCQGGVCTAAPPTCIKCSSLLPLALSGNIGALHMQLPNVCPGPSAGAESALDACACVGPCGGACAPSCSGNTPATQACMQCVSMACAPQVAACQMN